ncbi:polysaccharide deacetylase family protein [Tabrizicola piscis]|uniref:polysaccharide deacetylase family protein n=1 Tax=Tabrizicola piscis TaxID=2494374 RepID=UPI0013DD91AC|nr:polysaccharide deacetylase family protein [Tabrizicola piscis]
MACSLRNLIVKKNDGTLADHWPGDGWLQNFRFCLALLWVPMKTLLTDVTVKLGRAGKRAFRAAIDNRIADFHMPAKMPGDLLLTFDDGPHPDYTPRILDLLDEFDARAVFFMIGARAERHPDLVRACHDRGHVIANHTYTHLDTCAGGRYSRAQVAEDIERCSAVLQGAAGQTTHHFRPPRGELNTKTWGAAKATGHRMMLWSVEGGEWGRRRHLSAAEISDFVTKAVRRRDILLLHDDNEKTLRITADLLSRLRKERFDLTSAVASLR